MSNNIDETRIVWLDDDISRDQVFAAYRENTPGRSRESSGRGNYGNYGRSKLSRLFDITQQIQKPTLPETQQKVIEVPVGYGKTPKKIKGGNRAQPIFSLV